MISLLKPSGDFRFAMEKSAYWQEEVFSEHVTVDKDVGIFFGGFPSGKLTSNWRMIISMNIIYDHNHLMIIIIIWQTNINMENHNFS